MAPYYAKAGVAPPRPLPLPREITWPWTNGKPLPMPDCSNRPCGTIGKQIKGATAVEGCRLLPAMPKATAKSCAIAPAAPPGAIAAVTPARTEGKDLELHKWVQRWIEQLASASRASPVFCNLGDAGPASLECMLSQKAAGTLRKHLPGWKHWVAYTTAHAWAGLEPGLPQLVFFFKDLAETRICGAASLSAMKFTAALLGLETLQQQLAKPILTAWCEAGRRRRARKEALPLPLHAVAAFEQAIHADLQSELSHDSFLLIAFLTMMWGALRFSDVQRMDIASLAVADGLARGFCWRTKSAANGMPFGVLTSGIFANWGHALCKLGERMKACDFLICGPQGGRATFAYTLSSLRRLLMQRAGIPREAAFSFTLHSLKVTGLSWALQLDIEAQPGRRGGTTEARNRGRKLAAKYSRDDVLPAVRAQLQVLKALRCGWVPLTPQARGGATPVEETALDLSCKDMLEYPKALDPFLARSASTEMSDTESDSESASASSSDADAPEDWAPDAATSTVKKNGAYIVNRVTRFVHAAVASSEGHIGRACAPSQPVSAQHWEVWDTDPLNTAEAYIPCRHAACPEFRGKSLVGLIDV